MHNTIFIKIIQKLEEIENVCYMDNIKVPDNLKIHLGYNEWDDLMTCTDHGYIDYANKTCCGLKIVVVDREHYFKISKGIKLIFLDIDGVLNTLWTPIVDNMNPLIKWDPEKVYMIREIVNITGADVVLSSTWRKYKDIATILFDMGLLDIVIGKTPVIHGIDVKRGHEIQMFIDNMKEPVDEFVIIDDDEDMEHLMNKLVHINYLTGLTQQYKQIIIDKLKD